MLCRSHRLDRRKEQVFFLLLMYSKSKVTSDRHVGNKVNERKRYEDGMEIIE